MTGVIKKHVGQHKGKYFGGVPTLAGIVYLFLQLNLSIPALQKVPETQEQVIILEARMDSQKETQAQLTEEVRALTKALEEAGKERSTVIAKLEMIVLLQTETRADIKRILER